MSYSVSTLWVQPYPTHLENWIEVFQYSVVVIQLVVSVRGGGAGRVRDSVLRARSEPSKLC